MVHTVPYSQREHLPHLPLLGAAAFSSAPYFHYLRPDHAKYPDAVATHYHQKIRSKALSPDSTFRVAVADDADPWVDVGLAGAEAERTRWIRGEWVDGKWHSFETVGEERKDKVCEGRVLGYSSWTRSWPEGAQDAKAARQRPGATAVWSSDSLWKKLERTVGQLEAAYSHRVNPDRAESAENAAMVESHGLPQYLSLTKAAIERSKHVGHLYLAALAVDPSFHRRGVGARLMRWGLERAEVERCPILLIGTPSGCILYKKLGFESLGMISIPGLSGDHVMVYWPKSFEGSDVQQQVVDAVESPEVQAQTDAASTAAETAGA